MIRDRELYGYEIRKRLAAVGENLQLSYVYQTLKEMSDEGLLESHLERGELGPRRRLYRLTAKGRRELGRVFEEATELIHDFYEEYVSNLPPRYFSERFQRMMKEVYGGREAVALLISEPLTYLHREVLEGISRRPGSRRTYLIKPPEVSVAFDLPNLTILDGSFDDIPLKEKSLDGLVIVDIQDTANLRTSSREFRRVLRSGGVVAACAPFMSLGGADDPLDLGEFMKKAICAFSGRPFLEREAIRKALAETFDYVDVVSMSFMTAFVFGIKPI